MNITRINNLFRAYFIENKKMLLICCLISFGALTWGFANRAMPEISPLAPYALMIFLAGMFYNFPYKKNINAFYHSLPVSPAEKFTHSIVVLLILGIVIHSLALAGAYTGYYLVNPLFGNHINENRWALNGSPSILEQFTEIGWKGMLFYIMGLSVLLFGSVYFKSKALPKTFGVSIGFLFAISGYFLLLMRIAYRNFFAALKTGKVDHSMSFNLADSHFFQTHYYIIPIVLIVFFLSLTYLRLRETEV